MDLKDMRVAIVGLGLMGGSLALALRERDTCREVIGVVRREEAVREALERGAVHRATTDPAVVKEADMVILATPVRAILDLIPALSPHLRQGAILMDLGSTKAEIVQAMNALPPSVQPIGGHPMCGKEVSGLGAAEPTLYQKAVFVLTPLPRTAPWAVEVARQLVLAVGARPVILDPQRHDRAVAAISHLPYGLAVALTLTAAQVGATDPVVWELAASGFRDTSRLAASDVTMMLDILLTNREAVGEMLALAQTHLSRLMVLLAQGDEAELRELLETARAERQSRMVLVDW